MSNNQKPKGGGGGPQQQTIGGAPTKQRVNEFYDLMDAAQESGPVIPDLDVSDPPPNGMKAFDDFVLKNQGKFPIRPLPKDPYDTMWKIKSDLKEGGYVNPARPLPVTEEDLRYLKGKAAAEDYTAFLTWEASKYDLSDPATKEWFHKVCPSYFEQREQLIDDMIDLQAKYAKIRLRGPRSEDDLKLEFLIEKGDIELPTAPIWDPIQIYTNFKIENGKDVPLGPNASTQDIQKKVLDYNKRVYQAGLFSPLVPMSVGLSDKQEAKSISNHKRVMAPNPFNRADVAGDPERRFTGISGGLPPPESDYSIYVKDNQLGLKNRNTLFSDPNTPYHRHTQHGWNVISSAGSRGMQLGGANQ